MRVRNLYDMMKRGRPNNLFCGCMRWGRISQVCSIFSFLFFLTLFCLGLDTAFAVVETLQTYMNDWLLARNPGPDSARYHGVDHG
eukprot:207415-Amphidinium_carterae.2